jgi:hypothetical protein
VRNNRKNIYVFLIALLLSLINNSANSAREYSLNISWESIQFDCKESADYTSHMAFKFGELHEVILRETKPESHERKMYIGKMADAMLKQVEKVQMEVKTQEQGQNISLAIFAKIMIASANNAMNQAFDNPGKSKEWYQVRIFDECVRGMHKK